MTNKEIEKFIKKNLLGHLGLGFTQKGNYILISPVDDVLGGFCFEPSLIDRNSIYIWWLVQPLFIPENMIHLTFGGRIENSNYNQLWSDLNSLKTIETIKDAINNKKPLIESLSELALFYEYFNKKDRQNLRIYEALIYTLIWMGSYNWEQEIKDFIRFVDKFDVSIPWIKKLKEDMISLSLSKNPKQTLEDNKKNLTALLNI